MVNYSSYKELHAAATAPGATQADIDALGEWFSEYGCTFWNGECYDASAADEPTGTLSLYPIIKWDPETEQGEVVGYTFDAWKAAVSMI